MIKEDRLNDAHSVLEKLDKAGVKITNPRRQITNKSKIRNSNFLNKAIVFTGELDKMSRSEAKEKIRQLGGKISSSVSKNTDLVVIGREPGSKYKKAKKLGIKIIKE